jgi:hypothetical protein
MKYIHQIILIATISIHIIGCSENVTTSFSSETEGVIENVSEPSNLGEAPPATQGSKEQNKVKPKFVVVGSKLEVASTVPKKWFDLQTDHVQKRIEKGDFILGTTGPHFRMWGIIDESGKFLSWPEAPIALPYLNSEVTPTESGVEFNFGEKGGAF